MSQPFRIPIGIPIFNGTMLCDERSSNNDEPDLCCILQLGHTGLHTDGEKQWGNVHDIPVPIPQRQKSVDLHEDGSTMPSVDNGGNK